MTQIRKKIGHTILSTATTPTPIINVIYR